MAAGDPVKSTNENGEKVTHKVSTDYGHHETHQGNHFYTSKMSALSAAGTLDFLIVGQTADAAPGHFLPIVSANKEIKWELFRAPHITSVGTAMTIFNRDDRETGSIAATVTVFHTPSIGTGGTGTYLNGHITGSGNKAGGESRGSEEIIMRDATNYLFRVTADGGSTNASAEADWYESSDFY